MNKCRVFIVVILCLFTFILIQTLIYGLLNSWESLASVKQITSRNNHIDLKRQNKDVKDAVSEFLNACERVKIEVTLIDQEILAHLLDRIEKFSRDGRTEDDGHGGGCHYFCSKSVITFGALAPASNNKVEWEKLAEIVSIMNFKSEFIDGPDTRHATLESVGEFPSIFSHAVFFRKSVIIHVVLFHERKDRWWSTTCQPKVPIRKIGYYWRFVKKSSFCTHEHILPRIQSTVTLLDGLNVPVPLYIKKFNTKISGSTFFNCDLKRARQFYSVYGKEEGSEAEVFRFKAKNLLNQVKFALDKLGIPFWLSSGTCLGWFRQCDVIPHSKDVDIGIWIKDYNPKISDAMKDAGLVPKHIFGKVQDSLELSFRTASDDLKLDIFFFYEEGNIMWNGGTQAKTGKKFKYRFPKFSICWTEFMGILVRVPCDTITYIKANYGMSWNILMKEWDWKKSPSNVEENGQWPSDELAKVVQVFQ